MPRNGRGEWFRRASEEELGTIVDSIKPDDRIGLLHNWPLWARQDQLAPRGGWLVWLICAGRGYGKTRTGAEWVRWIATNEPEARIALVGASLPEVRAVMVEGESGLLSISPPNMRPEFEPTRRRLQWENGAQAMIYSAGEPESLRGPQHSHAWCDEVAKWDQSGNRAMAAWDNLLMGLRLGENPRVLATTTPRSVPLMRRLLEMEKDGQAVVTRGSTKDNADNLPDAFLRAMELQFGRTTLGRQEIDGQMIEDADGALWTRAMLECCREPEWSGTLVRTVVAVDPPASSRGDACGIIVAGITDHGQGKVLADASVEKASPEAWARAVASAAKHWQADRVIAEANQGGAMVESVLRAADCAMPVRLVHAQKGKAARAEPVAALYEAGRVNHAGRFDALEDQLCGLLAGGGYEGPGRSPDRADALVWALHELMLRRHTSPRVATI